MWTTLQDQSFLLGAALVILVHATKFGELNLGNPVTGRYIALLPGAKVRDFVGPYAYHIALFAFLAVSLVRDSPQYWQGYSYSDQSSRYPHSNGTPHYGGTYEGRPLSEWLRPGTW
jgi:hypothetical protein